MYHLHQTPGFVLGGAPHGEANRSLFVFTRDLGLVRARAQGVRHVRSKLRPHLREFSLHLFSFVRGGGGWRLTSVSPEEDFYPALRREPARLFAVSRVFSLLRRLVPDEERHEDLFLLFTEALPCFCDAGMPSADLAHLEAVVVLRMLKLLGYVGGSALVDALVASPLSAPELLRRAEAKRRALLFEINRSIKAASL